MFGKFSKGTRETSRECTEEVSRMRENCTYGSMRGSRRKTTKSVLRVVEDRADVPCGGVSPYSTPSKAL